METFDISAASLDRGLQGRMYLFNGLCPGSRSLITQRNTTMKLPKFKQRLVRSLGASKTIYLDTPLESMARLLRTSTPGNAGITKTMPSLLQSNSKPGQLRGAQLCCDGRHAGPNKGIYRMSYGRWDHQHWATQLPSCSTLFLVVSCSW